MKGAYIVTVDPVYDNSVVKKKETKGRLNMENMPGWTWRPEWRHVVEPVLMVGIHFFG